MAENLKARLLAAFGEKPREAREKGETPPKALISQEKALTFPPGAVSHSHIFGGKPDPGVCEDKSQKNQPSADDLTFLTFSREAAALRRILDDEAFCAFEERAAILEYEAGLSRAEAERRAAEEWLPP
ncbi:hypothetical protein [Neomegalonema perideroedes]|uniref:hypothetical protein n=1 Tax=Neomegalonema perideroedes TaxID=217219 RepID=UPI000360B91D|nr:hypothetical protein [Neomegalonema perideroedes]